MSSASFVFLDETGATTAMLSRYGWGPRSERLVDKAPQGHWRTTTFVAGLRETGIIAPLVLDGPMTGTVFRTYVEKVLTPTLQPGDVVVLDNLPAHKVKGVREAVLAAGAGLLYLPPPDQVRGRLYSPDLNPIEQAWSKLKASLRATGTRSGEALEAALGPALATISAQDATGWFRLAGYITPDN